MWPDIIRKDSPVCQPCFRCSRIGGFGRDGIGGCIPFETLFRFIGLPVNFKELGIENPDIDRLADNLHRNKGEFVGNYVKLTKQDSKEIYRLAL